MNRVSSARWCDGLLVLVWVAIAALLRLSHLDSKPLWADEFATIVFSLGHSFRSIPLNQVMGAEVLLQPLQPSPEANIGSVISHLLKESNHPPLYFVLTHVWLRGWPPVNGLVSIWGVRSLAALLGIASVPAIFGLGWLTFRSGWIAHLAAALMAVSPFGIYLAQEARHYTLPILWIMASLACLMIAVRSIRHHTHLPLWVAGIWVVVNGLGIATHYFFILTLGAEALVLGGMGLYRMACSRPAPTTQPVPESPAAGNHGRLAAWRRIIGVAMGTLTSCGVWFPLWSGIPDSELTRWIIQSDRSGWAWLEPVGQLLAGWITMLYLLPIQASSEWIVTVSGGILIVLFLWTLFRLYQGLRRHGSDPETGLGLRVMGGFIGSAIALFLGVTYILGMDLTRAFRYHFVYFPAMILLVAAGLAHEGVGSQDTRLKPISAPHPVSDLRLKSALSARLHRCWQGQSGGQRGIMIMWLLGLLGAVTVVSNLGYQKTHRPDLVAASIRQQSEVPALIAITHRTHGQAGRLMGIAWDLEQHPQPGEAKAHWYLLAHQAADLRSPIVPLERALIALPRPFDLWLVNFQPSPQEAPLAPLLDQQHCRVGSKRLAVDGYRYQRYRCDRRSKVALPQSEPPTKAVRDRGLEMRSMG
ncbi:MAG: glycosyltransferase [Cyanothece sp. SIO1E1]|nr:glycosyltransferase [Cyanothece sp. SIO1E1]